MRSRMRGVLGTFVGASLILLFFFALAGAQGTEPGIDNDANKACKSCQNTDPSKPRYCANISCSVETGGLTVSGKCGAPDKCRATSYQPLGGGMQALGFALQVVGLISSLAQQQQQGSAGVPAAAYVPPTTYGGCSNYYSVTATSSDPCAIYNPNPVSTFISQTPITDFNDVPEPTETKESVASALLNLLGETEESPSAFFSSSTKAELEELAGASALSATSSGQGNASTPREQVQVREGIHGTTFIANIRDSLSEVAGFFGGTVASGKGQSFAGRMCASRPWATGFIAKLLGTLLDALCVRLGFQLGEVAVEKMASQTGFTTETPRPASQPVFRPQAVQAEVDIWADPPSVRLGTRTKIFWRTAGVDSCRISGPSFEDSSLTGGGTTVSITGPTIFTIECILADGTTKQDSVTVNLSI